MHEYARKGDPIFPERWGFATPGSRLYDLGSFTSTMLSIGPTQRPSAAEIRRQLHRFHIRPGSPEATADTVCNDDFFVLPNPDTLAPTATPKPTVRSGLRFLSEAKARRGCLPLSMPFIY